MIVILKVIVKVIELNKEILSIPDIKVGVKVQKGKKWGIREKNKE